MNVIYLDFQKAFDKVLHEWLLLKVEAHGFVGRVCNCIKDWQTERQYGDLWQLFRVSRRFYPNLLGILKPVLASKGLIFLDNFLMFFFLVHKFLFPMALWNYNNNNASIFILNRLHQDDNERIIATLEQSRITFNDEQRNSEHLRPVDWYNMTDCIKYSLPNYLLLGVSFTAAVIIVLYFAVVWYGSLYKLFKRKVIFLKIIYVEPFCRA